MNGNSTPNPLAQWKTVAGLCDRMNAGSAHPAFTVYSLRHYIKHAATNGLAPHVRRVGRKVLIHEEGFLEWIENCPDASKGEAA